MDNGIEPLSAIRYVRLNRSKALDFYGKVMAFFFLSFAMTYAEGVINLIKSSDDTHKIHLNLFTYIMPFVSFIIDASVKRAYQIQAKTMICCTKIIIIFLYLSIYVAALERTSKSMIYWACNI